MMRGDERFFLPSRVCRHTFLFRPSAYDWGEGQNKILLFPEGNDAVDVLILWGNVIYRSVRLLGEADVIPVLSPWS